MRDLLKIFFTYIFILVSMCFVWPIYAQVGRGNLNPTPTPISGHNHNHPTPTPAPTPTASNHNHQAAHGTPAVPSRGGTSNTQNPSNNIFGRDTSKNPSGNDSRYMPFSNGGTKSSSSGMTRSTPTKKFQGDSMSKNMLVQTCISSTLKLKSNDFSTFRLYMNYEQLCKDSKQGGQYPGDKMSAEALKKTCTQGSLLGKDKFSTSQKYANYLSMCEKENSGTSFAGAGSFEKPGLMTAMPAPQTLCPHFDTTLSCTSLWQKYKEDQEDPRAVEKGNDKLSAKCSAWEQLDCCSKLNTVLSAEMLNPDLLVTKNEVSSMDLTTMAQYYLTDPSRDFKAKTESLNNQLSTIRRVQFRPLQVPSKIHFANEKHNLQAMNTITVFLLEKLHYSRYEVRTILAQMIAGNNQVVMNQQKEVLIDTISTQAKNFSNVALAVQPTEKSAVKKKNLELSGDLLALKRICKDLN